jgi:proteic killer suppression protein
VIRTIRHKGLRVLYEKDQTKGVRQDQLNRLRALLARLEAAANPADMDFPGLRLHPLKGDLDGFYAVDVSGNWRVIFRFDEEGNATDVDLIDYH